MQVVVPADFPTEQVLGKESQRPYVEFLATKEQASILYHKFEGKYPVVIQTDKKVAFNDTAKKAAENGRIPLTRMELKAPGQASVTTVTTTSLPLKPNVDSGWYVEKITEKDRSFIETVIIVNLEWCANGNLLLQEILNVLAIPEISKD